MPYTVDSEDLPDKVKGFTQHEKEIWVEAFNNSYDSCIDDGGKKDDCEGSAFSIAYAAVAKYQEDGRERTMNKSKLRIWIEGIINSILKQRAIKDVESWDGAASQYDSTEAYCSACLIDVNAAAGRDEKAQTHCMLPVKLNGETDLVKQAVYAAAGGHGISQVKRPDDVPEEDWNTAVTAAANKLISAYAEMEEEAPDSLYELAGKEKPEKQEAKFVFFNAAELKEVYAKSKYATDPKYHNDPNTRAIGIDEACWHLTLQIQAMDTYAWLNGLYLEGETIFAVISASGKLYRATVVLADDNFNVGPRESWVEVKLDFPPVGGAEEQQSRTTIKRQADGKFRWFSISASAVLNRVGEIDSRALFDSFIEHAEQTGEYPIRQFFHAGGKFRVGQCDFLGRDENLLITSGLYDDTPLARAEVEARTLEPEYWGDSIGFDPTSEPAHIRAGDGITILAYDQGILREISTLPEEWAASWYTATPVIQEVTRMLTEKQKEAFVKLMGSEAEADKWLEENAATRNREIEDAGLVTRTTPEPETEPEVEPGTDFVIDAESFTELVSRVGQGLQDPIKAAVASALAPVLAQVTELRSTVDSLKAEADKRLKALEKDESERTRIILEDAPKLTLSQTVRPRKPAPAEPEPEAEVGSAVADAVLAGIPEWGPKSK